jgi:hypothetical protein
VEEIEIIDTNPDNICDHGFCGIKNIKQEGYKRKTDWLRQRFSEGMRFKVLYSAKESSVGMIEYIPGGYAWRAVEAKGYITPDTGMHEGCKKGKDEWRSGDHS